MAGRVAGVLPCGDGVREHGCTAGTREARQHVGATLACRSRRVRSPVILNYLYEPALAQLLSVMLLRATRNNLRQRASSVLPTLAIFVCTLQPRRRTS